MENADLMLTCAHCGLPVKSRAFCQGELSFCCRGCLTAYRILSQNALCDYYSINPNAGNRVDFPEKTANYQFLEDPALQEQLLEYQSAEKNQVRFFLPAIHCSSCIWLLENLHQIDQGVISSRVDFLQKKVTIHYHPDQTTLFKLATLLAKLGYPPKITPGDSPGQENKSANRELYMKIGVAGFCFANIMLFSLPEYFDTARSLSPQLRAFFSYLNILLAMPVLFFSARDYLNSAYRSLRFATLNMDVPISLGILALFGRSLFEILFHTGPGYFDSFAGLVFLLLIGKLFQNKTYDRLRFDRDYKSFFPIAVTVKERKGEKSLPLSRVRVGDHLLIRNEEIIPADSVLFSGNAFIDYSFVTGEAEPVSRTNGDLIFAGGRQIGSAIEIEVVKKVSQSYLTQLWNDLKTPDSLRGSGMTSLADSVSKYFTLAVLLIASVSAIIWYPQSPDTAWKAFTAVLIVACPCALALSTPFALGNALRLLSKVKFYLKNTDVIESLAKITAVVFDKTGTLTINSGKQISFSGKGKKVTLNDFQQVLIKSLVRQSRHPLSHKLYNYLHGEPTTAIEDFREIAGKGIQGRVAGHLVKLGSEKFVRRHQNDHPEVNGAGMHISIDDAYLGAFYYQQEYRPGVFSLLQNIKSKFLLFLLSGDTDQERKYLQTFFLSPDHLRFRQTPQEKLDFIRSLRKKNERVLMLGDGLNDAGALAASDVGIVISDDLNNFVPACDAILNGKRLTILPRILKFAKGSVAVIRWSFGLSFLYNAAGLYFAARGALSPLVSAVLMPLSSISVVIFTTGATYLLAKRFGIKESAETEDAITAEITVPEQRANRPFSGETNRLLTKTKVPL